eukprot:TRINITY_DN2376_c0_g1_i1.p1 TRINITY_DN2376_c0_g1~~TRINITY_DN2376_c0_g1_i1.p1  ORF type:complete len:305 (-),score=36.86 TRINITY_DN2376_c0_g1_i1:172-1017(-)
MAANAVDSYLKGLMLKDLRIQCRLRGVSPAGGKETLSDRLRQHMISNSDFTIRDADGQIIGYLGDTRQNIPTTAASQDDVEHQSYNNNYQRPSGQNVDNFLTDRNSSRVLAPPGGSSNFSINQDNLDSSSQMIAAQQPNYTTNSIGLHAGGSSNNYYRPEGQNVGNFISDRPSSKVLAPPGGGSNFSISGDMMDYNQNTQKENIQIAQESVKVPIDIPQSEDKLCTDETMQGGAEGIGAAASGRNNNYHRPGGQNLGNFLTDRPSSRVLAAPGGNSSITFG